MWKKKKYQQECIPYRLLQWSPLDVSTGSLSPERVVCSLRGSSLPVNGYFWKPYLHIWSADRQWSCRKVMLSQVSVILFRGWVSLQWWPPDVTSGMGISSGVWLRWEGAWYSRSYGIPLGHWTWDTHPPPPLLTLSQHMPFNWQTGPSPMLGEVGSQILFLGEGW